MSAVVQISGFLYKLPFGHQSNKWAKRFFVVKDGYMLYYPDSEKKEFDKNRRFNIHPKGAVPLGGSHVESYTEVSHPYAIRISNEEFAVSPIILAAESEVERDNWLTVLQQSTRITFDNAELGDSMIQKLEAQSLQMSKEKQSYFDQLQSETKALHDEQCKTEELEKIRVEMEKERLKMEALTTELKQQYQAVQSELDETMGTLLEVEDDRKELHEQTAALQLNLTDLNTERDETMSKLQRHESEALKLSKENENLNEVTEALKKNLKSIEDKTNRIVEEKRKTEELLIQNQEQEDSLLGEKKYIADRVAELENSIKDLSEQKAITEAELKVEVMARLEAERRLREAEKSLSRLDKAVTRKSEGAGEVADERETHIVHQEMISDVLTLKKFFENLAFEAKIDSEKSVMIKNSIHARKTLVRRAMTMRYEKGRNQRNRDSTLPAVLKRRSFDTHAHIEEEESEVHFVVCQTSKSTENLDLDF